jgi:hypothetical protein
MRFLGILLASCLASACAYFGLAFALSPAPIAAEYWVREMIVVKRSIARRYQGTRKVIIASGSAGLFGIDSGQLGREIGTAALNFGMHAAMSLERILDEAAGAAGTGDAVVLTLEPHYYCARGPTDWQARSAIAWDRQQWREWSTLDRLKAMASLNPAVLLEIVTVRVRNASSSRTLSKRVATLDDARVLAAFAAAPEPETFAYSAYHLDRLGNMRRTEGAKFHERARSAAADTVVCPESLELLRGFVSRMRRHGIVVRIAHTPYVADGQPPTERVVAASSRFVEQMAPIAPVLDTRADVLLPREMFFNTDLHLNARGREIRTHRLAAAILNDSALAAHLGTHRPGR